MELLSGVSGQFIGGTEICGSVVMISCSGKLVAEAGDNSETQRKVSVKKAVEAGTKQRLVENLID
jgi:hypothetical protein